jgi:hypothetical protein
VRLAQIAMRVVARQMLHVRVVPRNFGACGFFRKHATRSPGAVRLGRRKRPATRDRARREDRTELLPLARSVFLCMIRVSAHRRRVSALRPRNRRNIAAPPRRAPVKEAVGLKWLVAPFVVLATALTPAAPSVHAQTAPSLQMFTAPPVTADTFNSGQCLDGALCAPVPSVPSSASVI